MSSAIQIPTLGSFQKFIYSYLKKRSADNVHVIYLIMSYAHNEMIFQIYLSVGSNKEDELFQGFLPDFISFVRHSYK